jgi:DNA-binding CsgD family transcriptional regulator
MNESVGSPSAVTCHPNGDKPAGNFDAGSSTCSRDSAASNLKYSPIWGNRLGRQAVTHLEPFGGLGFSGALGRLLLALQTGLSVDDVQSNYLDTIGAVVRANAYGFSQFDPLDAQLIPLRVMTRNAPEGLVPAYNQLGADNDPVLRAATSARTPVDNTRLVSHQPWHEQSLCVVLGGQGLYHSLVVPLCGKSRLRGALYLARSSAEPGFSGADIAALTVAQQHVQAALTRAVRHEELDRHASILAWSLDQLDVATIITARDGRTLFENKAVRRLAQAGEAADRIADVVTANLRSLGRGPQRVVVQSDGLPSDQVVTVKSTALRPGSEVMVSFVFVQRKGISAPVDRAPLSIREREIVSWVAEGFTNRQIAELAFVSENTVRQHLKRIFGKLNVHSRAQLIQALWQSWDRPG